MFSFRELFLRTTLSDSPPSPLYTCTRDACHDPSPPHLNHTYTHVHTLFVVPCTIRVVNHDKLNMVHLYKSRRILYCKHSFTDLDKSSTLIPLRGAFSLLVLSASVPQNTCRTIIWCWLVCLYAVLCQIITVRLHVMQHTVLLSEFCLSVHLSVRQMRVLWEN